MVTIVKKLKVLFTFLRLPSDGLVSRLTQIHDKMAGNAAFPNPPVDMAVFLTAITTFAASVVVALDGSKQAKAILQKQREGLVQMAEQLGHYVEAASNNDPATITSSGFEIRSTSRVPTPQLAQPAINSVDQGKSGEILVNVDAVDNARIYEVEYAPLSTAGTSPVWTRITAATVRKPVSVQNLTPGTTYMFHVRAFGGPGFTDWSQPVQRMCI
jgi:Fibronectin type III domain